MNCLIVEDDKNFLLTLNELLLQLGHEATSVGSLAEASQALHARKFDILLLDYHLPDGTSDEFSTFAAVTQPNCRIILLTGSRVFPGGENAQMAHGIDWILRKPASMNDLAALIDYAAVDAASHPTSAPATAQALF